MIIYIDYKGASGGAPGLYDTLILYNFGTTTDETSYHHDLTTVTGTINSNDITFGGYGSNDWAVFTPYDTCTLGTDDFTIQIYVTLANADQPGLYPTIMEFGYIVGGHGHGIMLRYDASGTGNPGQWQLFSTYSPGSVYTTGTWTAKKYHACIMCISGQMALWLDGVRVTNYIDAPTDLTSPMYLDLSAQNYDNTTVSGGSEFEGSISSFKVTRGTALFNPSGFTPPTEPLLLD